MGFCGMDLKNKNVKRSKEHLLVVTLFTELTAQSVMNDE